MSTINGRGPGQGPGQGPVSRPRVLLAAPNAGQSSSEQAPVTERLTSAPTPTPTPSAGTRTGAGSGSFAAEPSAFSHPRFELLARLGRGGMGVVYAAYDRDKLRRVALKTLHSLESESLLRFKNEFRALADLQHDNLVRLDELFEQSGQWFFTMELIEGEPFLSYVRPGSGSPSRGMQDSDSSTSQDRTASETSDVPDGEPPPSESAELPAPAQPSSGFDERRLRDTIGQLTYGLCALHAADKVHCDIKPSSSAIVGKQVLKF